VNTETTDKQDSIPVQGWVGYDDDCGLCVGLLKRFGGPFERRGFVFVPLQNPWLAGRLGLTAAASGELKPSSRSCGPPGGPRHWDGSHGCRLSGQ
jgi:hypothetical protein